MNRDGLLVGLIRNALRDVGNQSDPNQVPPTKSVSCFDWEFCVLWHDGEVMGVKVSV